MKTVEQILEALAVVGTTIKSKKRGDFVPAPASPITPDTNHTHIGCQCCPRAMGRWQVHPDRVWSESRLRRVAPNLGETWDSWIGRILTVIFKGLYPVESPVAIAMYWHLGHFSKPDATDWDEDYAAKFTAALKAAGSDGI